MSIELALATGSASLRDIARQYDLSKDALARHKKHHMGAVVDALRGHVESVREAGERARGEAVAMSVRQQLERAIDKAEDAEKEAIAVIRAASGKKDFLAAAAAVRGLVAATGEFRQSVVALGRVTGEVPVGAKVAIQVNVGGVSVDATADELRNLVARASAYFTEKRPELIEEFRAYLTEATA